MADRRKRFSKQRSSALKTLADISHIITSSHDAVETLMHTAETIAELIHVDACSIYVCEGNELAIRDRCHRLLRMPYGAPSQFL